MRGAEPLPVIVTVFRWCRLVVSGTAADAVTPYSSVAAYF